VAAFADGPVSIEIDHADYAESVELPDSTRVELLTDLR
jgi:hypothetical protein